MKHGILYTMDGCPHCKNLKDLLTERNIVVDIRNIKDYEDEYKKFVEATENEFLPAFTFVETFEHEEPNVRLLVPDEDFNNIQEATDIIEKFLL